MFTPPDYSIIDRLGLAGAMFYPRPDWSAIPAGATGHRIPVAEGITVEARFYRQNVLYPTLLYFHGNGEVASDYDSFAHLFKQAGVNLMVAEFRGYGGSLGTPAFGAMLADAHGTLRFVEDLLRSEGFSPTLFLMGRSLGAHSAVELAAHYPGRIAGLIVESGATSVSRMAERLATAGYTSAAAELSALHEAKLRSIAVPVLIIHGEWDELIPVASAVAFYELPGVGPKKLVIIPRAGHNDIMLTGLRQYFTEIQAFVAAHAPPA